MENPDQQPAEEKKIEVPQEFIALVGDGVSFGAGVAVTKFVAHHSAKTGTPEVEKLVVTDFIVRLSSEFTGAAVPYPFDPEVSYRKTIEAAIDGMAGVLFALYKNKEIDQMSALCRIAGLGETLKFLEANKFEAMKAVTEIRKTIETPPVEVDLPPDGKVEITD